MILLVSHLFIEHNSILQRNDFGKKIKLIYYEPVKSIKILILKKK